MNKIIAAILIFITLFSWQAVSQKIIYVDAASTDIEDGNSWNTPYHTLQTAITKAEEGDEIWVAIGKYSPTELDRNGNNSSGADLTFFINKDITILGGFERGDNLSQRDPQNKVTTLNGANDGFTHYQVVNINSCSAILDGFTITKGVANGTGELDKGAGIYIDSDGKSISPRIENCRIESNVSDGDGAGVYVTDNGGTIDFSFVNCQFVNNMSMENGGGLYANNHFGNNPILLEGCIFTNNTSNISGGGAYLNMSYTGNGLPIYRIHNTDFTNNIANSTLSSYAGALYLRTNSSSLQPLVEQCNFENNNSENNGGAVRLISSSGGAFNPTFNRCRFASNVTGGSGGAIATRAFANICDPTFINCIFFNNFGSASAGAISLSTDGAGTSDTQFYYCDFVKNSSNLFGAVFRILSTTTGGVLNVTITNSVFYQNTNGSTPRDININSNNTAIIVQSLTDRSDCTNTGATNCNNVIFNADPLFFNASTGALRIRELSPAIGNAITVEGSLFEVDYVGMPRPIENPDIGAYQYDKDVVAPLSVEWVAFNGVQKAQQIILNWKTVNEHETAYYVIEHSYDGRNFSKIGRVAAANQRSLRNYQFLHSPLTSGEHFYRIIQVANDDSKDISKVIIVDYKKEQSIQVYPNPARDALYFSGDSIENSIIQLIDYQGIIRKEVPFLKQSIYVNDLPTGLYLVRDKNGSWQQRILIEN